LERRSHQKNLRRLFDHIPVPQDDRTVDTVMPDKIVKRVINEILVKAGLAPISDDIAFIKRAEELALRCGCSLV